jgi:hypothetical protein
MYGYIQLNDCIGAYEYLLNKANPNEQKVSRLFVYYNARLKKNMQTMTDSGCSMTAGIEAL